jgi:hypothetical protein
MRGTSRSSESTTLPKAHAFRPMLRLAVIFPILFLFAGVTGAANAVAAPQSSDQQRCIVAMSESVANVAKAQQRVNLDCVKDAGRGRTERLGTPATALACLGNDSKGEVLKARLRSVRIESEKCLAGPEQQPDFGYAGSGQANATAMLQSRLLLRDLLSADINAVVADAEQDQDVARCRTLIIGRIARVFNATMRVWIRALKIGLRDGSIGTFSALEQAILDALVTDAKGKLARAQSKLASDLERQCVSLASRAMDLSTAFPGECADAPDRSAFAACAGERVRCRACLAANGANASHAGCDHIDNGLLDGSCLESGFGFVSADSANGLASPRVPGGDPAEVFTTFDTTTEAPGDERSVEEGDIYRVLANHLILNLNAYRGLQVIDFSDVENPDIIGRLQVSGTPVELYVVGDQAFVLLNNWRGYYGGRTDVTVEACEGSLVLSVDLSNPADPTIIDRAHVPGYIQTSRLTRGGGQAALYVVTGGWAQWENEDGELVWESRTVVQSFDVSEGRLEARTQLNLGGYVADIQATTEALLVARNDWGASDPGSRISLVDIRDPGGRMVEGDDVVAAGFIDNQFNLDLYNGVLRVVSGSRWGSERTNHLQTFDASDIHNLTPIDHATFGANEDLFATLFLGNKAFFVTYFRVDPFHAFFIDDEGFATEMSEFLVSGWNDFFRAVRGESRLIGIGVNDEAGRTLSVSLYDIVDLTNPDPLVARADVEADSSWSEASWDHRAFSVLEDTVEVAEPGGVIETGLVLLPFSGWSDDRNTYTSAVQIFTFSANTLTRRGLMDHGTPVRRSFLADEATTSNLSDLELSFFDTTSPDDPRELSRVELAPNYTDFFIFGDYGARIKDSVEYYTGWWGDRTELPPATVEVIPVSQHPDLAEPVARFEIPAGATSYQVGDLLVTVNQEVVDTSEWPYSYESRIAVWDLADPTQPQRAGSLTTDRLRPSFAYVPWLACLDCDFLVLAPILGLARIPIFSPPSGDDVQSIEHALVFLQRHHEQELLATDEICTTYPAGPTSCSAPGDAAGDCTYYSGSIECRSLEGAEPYCTGALYECTLAAGGEPSCAPVEPGSIATHEVCSQYPRYRYWQRFTIDVLDLTTPSTPVLADAIELPLEEEGVSMLADGTDVWISLKRPEKVEDDSRPHVRYFIRRIGLEEPSAPQLDEPINVPGELLVIDGTTIFTRDTVWGDEIVETAVARLEILEGFAFLQAKRVFPDQQVDTIVLDGAGHLLVSHRLAWAIAYARGEYEPIQHLSVLDANSDDFEVLAEVEVDDFAQLRDARSGRALFQVPGGLLVFNLDDPTAPYAQAFFATRGWPREILIDQGRIIFAAGRYGIYAFDLDTVNLLPVD